MKQRASRSAFTLVELSIVLVILGLLVGGVLSGQSLIHAAELRSIAQERTNYATAINAFRDKYFALPGDMPNAFAFWGTACGTNTSGGDTACNGNGDGIINHNNVEYLRVWEHLSRAGLIEGSFDGLQDPASGLNTTNIPKSRYPSGAWHVLYIPFPGGMGLSASESSVNQNFIGFGKVDMLTGSAPDGQLDANDKLHREDAWNVDRKMDDGRARTGSLRGVDGVTTCLDTGTDAYSIQAQGPEGACGLMWFLER